MRTISYITIVYSIAICAAVLAALSIIFGNLLFPNDVWLFAIFVALFVFLVMYLISYYTTKKFLVDKIRPIYKTILETQQQTHQRLDNQEIDNFDILASTEKQVEHWAQRRLLEREKLKQLEKYRKEYIGNISHELKTPIFAVQGYISTLLDGGLHDDSINVLYLKKADKATQRMITIVRDLDAITRLESGELTLDYSHFDILALINEIFEAHETLAKQHNVTLTVHPQNHKKIYVHADKAKITMVLTNLIVNAIAYNDKAKGEVDIRFYDMENLILIEVADNGAGIAKEHLNRIFERFYRVDKSRSREMGGSGLGLAIVKHIIEAHGQTINVNSTVYQGTSFTFTLEQSK
ncbi:MAG: sensor histidine kinase [Bacteroidales bacterium]|jgi:two-component system phosphate regulon sensor histidine kinase PhoR|nr:sensor histidine kinase [Bacteroidales bacterium]